MQLLTARNLVVSALAAVSLSLFIGPALVLGGDEEPEAGESSYFTGSEYEPNQTVYIDGYEHRCNGQTGVLVRGSKVCD